MHSERMKTREGIRVKRGLITTWFCFILLTSSQAFADIAFSDRLSSLIKKTLEEKIPGAEIILPSLERITQDPELADFETLADVRLLEDRVNGVAVFEIIGKDPESKVITRTVQSPYEAWLKVPVALHRIYPNSKLKDTDFKISSVNVATGQPREYRGIMVPANTRFERMEAHQTILEGQFVVTSALRKQPDVRRGDLVKLELESGDLSLTTQAVAQEPASIGEKVRVLTVKTKREVVGTLREDHSVGVSL